MKKSISERELVLDILLSITRDGEYSHIALRNVLDKYCYLEKRERAFITRVTEGTLERQIELDYIINQFSKVPVSKMKPVIRTIIRSAVYQMKYMDSVPNSAVCNEAVKLAAKRGFTNLKGFVNGLLRNIGRNLDQIQYPEKEQRSLYLSIKYSMPEWILGQWLDAYDVDTVEQILKEFMKEKPLSIRFDEQKISKSELIGKLEAEGVTVEEHSQLPYALFLSGYDYLDALQSFREGLFQVQDISSMKVAEVAEVKPEDYVIDVCAAPGGKAIHIAEKLGGTGMVEARDLTNYKVNLIRENIERAGLKNIVTVCQDATEYTEESKEKADIVIADLPCSGLGVIGKKPDLKYRMTKEQQKDLVELQRRILGIVKTYVKPGGKLVYSTCTIHRGENEENAIWFGKKFKDFKLVSEEQMLPGNENGDGFYIAVFERNHNE
ncbi:16S rRNA (cytosine(967)-C(5))-methyltransferase RsmB [Lachnospiraceae bacterium OttesenSCG-928-E19]|nr:16S rRNA (cytosine(967)-C(5))-methyltransferase RsmB [Lachnospiraceae bacterium OttesenSCG-928-E19]